jgi:hypothetical protein
MNAIQRSSFSNPAALDVALDDVPETRAGSAQVAAERTSAPSGDPIAAYVAQNGLHAAALQPASAALGFAPAESGITTSRSPADDADDLMQMARVQEQRSQERDDKSGDAKGKVLTGWPW